MKKAIYMFFLIFMYHYSAEAQQIHLNSQYMFDKFQINPACVGVNSSINTSLNVRQHLAGIEGAPNTQTISIDAPIQSKYMGVGLKIISDKLGASNQTSFLGAYSYQIGFGNGKLSFGLEGGLLNYNIDFANLIIGDEDEDFAIPKGKESVYLPDASFGIYYYSDKFFAGYSAFHLIKGHFNYESTGYIGQEALSKHHLFVLGYLSELSEEISFEPLLLLKTVQGAPLQVDFVANFRYKNIFSFATLYRTGDALSLILNVNVNEHVRIGYSYDLTTSKLSSYINGAHEIRLSYVHKLLKPAGRKEVHPIFYVK